MRKRDECHATPLASAAVATCTPRPRTHDATPPSIAVVHVPIADRVRPSAEHMHA
jgi:hypothetical protein